MEKYNLEQTGQQVQKILNESTPQSELTAETERAQLAEQQLQNDIDAIEEKIPSGASSSNKLATEEYVDDSISTATATFRGTFNLVSDLGLTVDATEQQIAAALASEISTADNNDYCFVQIPTSDETPTEIEEIDRYKFNGTAWAFEYELNSSGFTAAEWAAINSGITSELVTKLGNLPTAAALAEALASKQNVLTFDNVPTENSNNPVKSGGVYSAIDDEETRAKAAEKQNADDIDSLEAAIEAILLLIPTAASSLNKLADKAFVNSSIATNTATFRGTFNLVNDLHLTLAATHAQVGNALALAILDSDNNDYCFVQIPTVETAPNEIAQTDRYKYNGTTWEYEYTLNNSGFTSSQWIAINSGITSVLVSKLSELPTNSELTSELGTLSAAITAINQKIPAAAAQNNKLVDTAALESYIVQVLGVLTVSYNITSSDGHVTLAIQQTDGKITSVSLTTSDIASAAALNLKASQADLTALANRVTTAEGNISTLGGRVSTNETDIANLQDAYAGLTQSDIIIGSLPGSGVRNKIYRVPGTNSYSDYMWNGSTWVLMATYNNAIDPRPKKASQNLVTSGGVFDNMGALDISELNATENPHTLATYADLSAALAAIPSNDYKKGGMSIKFVQTSDNMYMQYRLVADEWSTDTDDWAFCGNDVYIDNPEWLKVVTDKNDKILYGVKTDGNFYFGTDCPPQVKVYVQEQIIKYDAAVNELLNTKVDKITGKSLIDANFANSQEVIDNPEWMEVVTDSEGKILEARKTDGTKVEYTNVDYPNGIPNKIKDELDKKPDKPINSVNNNIVIFDENGGIKDSGYNINNLPDELPSGGNDGDVLTTDGNGNYSWEMPSSPTQAQVDSAVYDWLDEHPEATTTVQDDSITFAKLASGLKDIQYIDLKTGDGGSTIVGAESGGSGKYGTVAVGAHNLPNATGTKNVTVGNDNMSAAGTNETPTGSRNVSMGYHSLFRLTSGNDNACYGAEAGDDNTSGGCNTAIGACSLQRNTQGSFNVAIGYLAMKGFPDTYTEGNKVNENIAIGSQALRRVSSGMHYNIAIGSGAMKNDTTHKNCIVLGKDAEASQDGQIILGTISQSEIIVLGNKKLIFNNDGTVTWTTIN